MSDDRADWVDAVSNAIRKADGNHTMGAGALAEVAVDVLYPLMREREMAVVTDALASEEILREQLAYWIEQRAAAHSAYSPEKRVLVECAIWIKTGRWES